MRPIGDRQVSTARDSQEQYVVLQDRKSHDILTRPRNGVLSNEQRLTLRRSKPPEAAPLVEA